MASPWVARVAEVLRLAGHARPEDLATELLGFLLFKVRMGDTSSAYTYSCPREVDSAWHTVILNTAFYSELCEKCLCAFVHHAQQPFDPIERLLRAQRYVTALGLPWSGALDATWTPDHVPFQLFTLDELEEKDAGAAAQSRKRRFLKRHAPSSDRATIKIKDQIGDTTSISVRPTTTITQIKAAYSVNRRLAGSMFIMLSLDGSRVREDATVANLGLKNGDELDARIEQTGC